MTEAVENKKDDTNSASPPAQTEHNSVETTNTPDMPDAEKQGISKDTPEASESPSPTAPDNPDENKAGQTVDSPEAAAPESTPAPDSTASAIEGSAIDSDEEEIEEELEEEIEEETYWILKISKDKILFAALALIVLAVIVYFMFFKK